MADHVRKQIRAAIVTTLTGLSSTGTRVSAARVDDHPTDKLPAIVVDTSEGGDIEAASIGGAGRYLERNLTVSVTVYVKAASGYADTVDQCFKEIEIALAGNQSLGGLCKFIQPLNEPQVEISDDSEKPVARARQNFLVPYITALNAPDVAH